MNKCLCCPLSPISAVPCAPLVEGESEEVKDGDEVEDEVVDEALIDDSEGMAGVGVDQVEDDVEAQQVRKPRGHTTPYQPTAKEVELHNLTHGVYRSWCPFCVAGRRPNSAHKKADKSRTIPLLVGDYAFVRDSRDSELLTMFVAKLLPYGVVFAMAVEQKGEDPDNVQRLAKWLRDSGLTHFAYRSDQEASIIALIEAAAREAGHEAVAEDGDAVVAVPENSAVGESASNGIAVRTV